MMKASRLEHASPETPERAAKRRGIVLFLLTLACCVMFIMDILTGSVRIPVSEVIRIVLEGQSDSTAWLFIVEKIRIPKALTAVVAGCSLSVSGLQMQTLFRNPLAGPSELGITAGAGLGVAAVMLTTGGAVNLHAIKESGVGGGWIVALMSSAGSALVLMLVLLIARRVRDHVILLIVGVMMGTITLSVISLWQYFSRPEQLQEYIFWTFGSLGGVTGSQLQILGWVTFFGLCLTLASSKWLNALLLGAYYAKSMGVTTGRARFVILLSTSILTGSVTAFCGPIGFVGIAVPHIARSLFNSADHRLLIPGCCLTGVLLMLICDVMTQLPGTEHVLPVNVVTSLLGAPVVIWVIIRNNNLRSSFQ